MHAIETDRQILVCLTTGKRNGENGFQLTGQAIHRMLEMQKDNRLTVKPRIKNLQNGGNRDDGSRGGTGGIGDTGGSGDTGGRHGGGGDPGFIADDDFIDAQETSRQRGGGLDV